MSDGDSLDRKGHSPSEKVQKISSKLKSVSIILMHNSAKNTPEALPQIIGAVRAQDYEFVPISELIPNGDYQTDHKGRMHLTEDE